MASGSSRPAPPTTPCPPTRISPATSSCRIPWNPRSPASRNIICSRGTAAPSPSRPRGADSASSSTSTPSIGNRRSTINGQSVGLHKGGYDAFTYDITPYLTGSGPQELIVRVYKAVDYAGEPRGKQTLFQGGIMYTSSTGIWQPVWLEPVSATSISDIRLVPDIDNSSLNLSVAIAGPTNGVIVNAIARSNGTLINTITGAPGLTNFALPIPSPNSVEPHQSVPLRSLRHTLECHQRHRFRRQLLRHAQGQPRHQRQPDKDPVEQPVRLRIWSARPGLLAGWHLHRAYGRRLEERS